MSILPEGENIRRAVQWITEELKAYPAVKITKLLDEAGMRYNLSPRESDTLFRLLTEKGPENNWS